MHDYRPEKPKEAEDGTNMFGDTFRNYEDSARQAVVVSALARDTLPSKQHDTLMRGCLVLRRRATVSSTLR